MHNAWSARPVPYGSRLREGPSKMRRSGQRGSVGLAQQRPSQGYDLLGGNAESLVQDFGWG